MLGEGLRVLVVGAGSIGIRHFRNLVRHTSAEVAVCSRHLTSPLHEAGRATTLFTDLASSFDWKPHAVIVCSSSDQHLQDLRTAISYGCDVFVEKPIAIGADGVEDILRLAEKKACSVVVGYNLRWLPSLRMLKKTIETGEVGRALYAHVHAGSYLPDWRPGRDYRTCYSASRGHGGGVALDLSHEFDYALWLFGEVHAVHGSSGKLSRLEIDAEDWCEASLTFVSGMRATLHVNYVERPPSRSCQVIAERGTLLWDLTGRTFTISQSGGGGRLYTEPEDFDLERTYVDELLHFLRVVQGEETPAVNGWDALAALRLALTARDGGTLKGRTGTAH